MSAIKRFLIFIIMFGLAGCQRQGIKQSAANAAFGEYVNHPLVMTFPPPGLQSEYNMIPVSSSHDAALTPVQIPDPVADHNLAERLPVEKYRFIEKAGHRGAPYDEEYSIQVESSLWTAFSGVEEGGWLKYKASTTNAPHCLLEIKLPAETTYNADEILAAQNRYRRMGDFSATGLKYDIFSFTSDSSSLADTQNVIYILKEIHGDRPFLVKPFFHASSAYEEWDKCRPLVRNLLSTLEMKRIPRTE